MKRLNPKRATRPSQSTIAAALALVALFVALGGGAWALTTKDKSVNRASTVTLDGGSDASPATVELLNVGGVSVGGDCRVSGGDVGFKITVTNNLTHSVLLAGQFGSAELAPNDEEGMIVDGATGGVAAARQTSFAIIDRGGTSATLLAAASGHPATGDCVFTAQAAG